jgi:hypothetical protein
MEKAVCNTVWPFSMLRRSCTTSRRRPSANTVRRFSMLPRIRTTSWRRIGFVKEDLHYFEEEAVCNTICRSSMLPRICATSRRRPSANPVRRFSMLPRIRTTSWRRPSAIRIGASVCFRGSALLRGGDRLQYGFGASVCSRGSVLLCGGGCLQYGLAPQHAAEDRLREGGSAILPGGGRLQYGWRHSMLPSIRTTSWRRPSAIRSRASVYFRGPALLP